MHDARRRTTTTPTFYSALLPYLGGKRRLAPLIFALLETNLPRETWGDRVFLDPMCGGGAVALTAKAHGFQVVASDIATRGWIAASGLIANNHVRLDDRDLAAMATGSVSRALPPALTSICTPAQAEWLARASAAADAGTEPRRSLRWLLIVKLLLRWFPLSLPSATDAAAAARGDTDDVSPRRLGHYLRAQHSLTARTLERAAAQVNTGVFGGAGRAERGDARAVLERTTADIAYLDPPYPGTAGYTKSYAAVDALLGGDRPSGSPPSLDELLDAARHIPLVVVSYGGPAQTLEAVVRVVERHRPVLQARAVPYTHLPALAKEATHAKDTELLILAGAR